MTTLTGAPAVTRSQERMAGPAELGLADAVYDALRTTGHAALRNLDIEVSRGTVVLWGRVGSYYQKQLAQVIVQQVAGVRGVANGLEVICESRRERISVDQP
jgi:hypothetical protein